MKLTVLLALGAMALATPALAAACGEDLKAVDTAMSTAKLSDADMTKVKTARAKADELSKAGKDAECEKALAEAQKLLGIKHK